MRNGSNGRPAAAAAAASRSPRRPLPAVTRRPHVRHDPVGGAKRREIAHSAASPKQANCKHTGGRAGTKPIRRGGRRLLPANCAAGGRWFGQVEGLKGACLDDGSDAGCGGRGGPAPAAPVRQESDLPLGPGDAGDSHKRDWFKDQVFALANGTTVNAC